MRVFLWSLVALAGVVGLLWAWLVIRDYRAKQKLEAYYAEHPLLKSLHVAAAIDSDGWLKTHSPEAKEALLVRLPLGTPAEDIAGILAADDIQCDMAPPPWRHVDCGVSKKAREHHVPNWTFRLTPDHSNRLVHADVRIAK